MVFNWCLSELFLVFFYHLRTARFYHVAICKCSFILPGLTETVWCHIFMLLLLLFMRNFYWYFAVYWYRYFDVVSNITFFCWVEALLWYIIHIIIHTIKDAVRIATCGFCRISGGCRLNRKIPDYPSLDPRKENLLHLLVYWYVCLVVETKMQCDYFHKDSFGLWIFFAVQTIQYWIHERYILRISCLIHWCSGI